MSAFTIICSGVSRVSNYLQGAVTDATVKELCRRLPCSQQPKVHVNASGVAFDYIYPPSLHSLDPFLLTCGSGNFDFENSRPGLRDIPILVHTSALSSPPKEYSRIGFGAVVLFVVEVLMLLLFDAQLMVANAVSPEFMYFWVAQVVVASMSLVFFTCGICSWYWRSVFELFCAIVCLFSNVFIIISSAMVIARYNFASTQIYALRMSFLASRSFNCFFCIVTVRRQLLSCFQPCNGSKRLLLEDEVPEKNSKMPVSAASYITSLHPSSAALPALNVSVVKQYFTVLKRITNRLILLENFHSCQEYLSCREELLRICPPQNRLLLSIGNIWENVVPEALQSFCEVSQGGHMFVECSSDGRLGLTELFDACSVVCKWLRSNSLNTVVVFHQKVHSCAAAVLCCGVFIASGLSPKCEHALHLVSLSLMIHEAREIGLLTNAYSRHILRHFECFFNAEQHPIRAFPRFMSMVALKGCTMLPLGFSFSIDVICSGRTIVSSGKWYKSTADGYVACNIGCSLSSNGICTFFFEDCSIFCRGDVEIVILVKKADVGVSAKVARVWSHSSFCGISEPNILHLSSSEVDWLVLKDDVPRFFTDVELHFGKPRGNVPDESTLVLGAHVLHFNQYAYDPNAFFKKLLAIGSQKQFASGTIIKPDHSNNRCSSFVVVVNGACSVEFSSPKMLKSAACVLQGLSSGKMLPSLKVNPCDFLIVDLLVNEFADVFGIRRSSLQICRLGSNHSYRTCVAFLAAIQ